MADILSRNAPVPVKILNSPITPPLPVANLLRREGRATVDEPTTETAAPRPAVRRGVLAAGAVLAAGSVFGITLFNDTAADQQSLADPPHAGQGVLDGTTPAAAPVVISPAAASSGLDAGMSTPTAWAPVAFPSGVTGTGGATKAAATATGTDRAAPAGSTRAPQVTPTSTTGDGSTSNPGSTGPAPTAAGSSTANTAPAGAPRGPVTGTVNGLGNTVTNTGTALGGAVDPVVAPVGSLLGGLL